MVTQTDNEYIFSLDIGTRSVMGVVSQKIDDEYMVLDYEIEAHPDRAMLDGQIHDIDKVTKVVARVKAILENRLSCSFDEVSIAAAGRALKTNQVCVQTDLDPTAEINGELVALLEMEGVQKAQKNLVKEHAKTDELRYHCVGYSVIRYFLDGNMIINPKGHRGGMLKVDIIATFLPHIVVDSLYTVMSRCGLKVSSLTLEPIAAMNIAIPQKVRLLNLALVDVGAGTSDIAITKDGTILSYGMVDKAGDEITEALLRAYLLDFETAEQLKIRLMSEQKLEFTDVVGTVYEKSRDEILDSIQDTIDEITEEIAQRIHQINERPPSAIFCIGGGCQIPRFVDSLAQKLDLPNERVAIKGVESLDGVRFEKNPLIGPEFITPLGIGYTKVIQHHQDFVQVLVNDLPVRLLNAKTLKVSDALIIAGFNARKLLSERGESFNVFINGEERRIAGAYGEPAKIWINGVPAGLGSEIKNQDRIVVEPATSGEQNKVKLQELIDLTASVRVGYKRINLIQLVRVNGTFQLGDYIVSPNDDIQYRVLKTAEDLAQVLQLSHAEGMFIRNGEKLLPDDIIKNKDKLLINKDALKYSENVSLQVNYSSALENRRGVDVKENIGNDDLQEVRNQVTTTEYHDTKYENMEYEDVEYEYSEQMDDGELEELVVRPRFDLVQTYDYVLVVNGKTIEITEFDREMVFVDVFNYIDFDLKTPKGIPKLILNGMPAKYTDKLKSGDVIEIGWKKL